MITTLRDRSRQYNLIVALIAVAVLALAFLLGQRASATLLGLLVAGFGALVLLARPSLGLLALVAAALILPLEFGTGTAVRLNPVTLLAPAVLTLALLDQVRRRHIHFVSTRANLPLLLFLLASLFSLVFGLATWDSFVPRGGNFIVVQLAQWGVFVLSAVAFWLTANLVSSERWLRRLTWTFMLIAGVGAIMRSVPGVGGMASQVTTGAFIRTPFWVLLTGVAAGQLLFNRSLIVAWRVFLVITLAAALVYAFVEQQEAASNWVGLVAVLGALTWLRFPRLRWMLVLLVVALAITGVLIPSVYDFAGGDAEWDTSGGSRLVLIERVIEVTMRNPITGLGPAAYRPYANVKPLSYQGAYWVAPQINSHNNYVDLFAHVGIVGLALFFWFTAEIARLGIRLRQRYTHGFAAGYVNGVLAVGSAALVIMALADWILPFVYNIGFHGFQASVLVWLFLGGLVALENMPDGSEQSRGNH